MYARQPQSERYDRDSRGLRVPGNYSGNAFRDYQRDMHAADEDNDKIAADNTSDSAEDEATAKASSTSDYDKGSQKSVPVGLGRLMGGGGGIGLEELLILGLVFLISQNDEKDDLAFLLLMLLFIR